MYKTWIWDLVKKILFRGLFQIYVSDKDIFPLGHPKWLKSRKLSNTPQKEHKLCVCSGVGTSEKRT